MHFHQRPADPGEDPRGEPYYVIDAGDRHVPIRGPCEMSHEGKMIHCIVERSLFVARDGGPWTGPLSAQLFLDPFARWAGIVNECPGDEDGGETADDAPRPSTDLPRQDEVLGKECYGPPAHLFRVTEKVLRIRGFRGPAEPGDVHVNVEIGKLRILEHLLEPPTYQTYLDNLQASQDLFFNVGVGAFDHLGTREPVTFSILARPEDCSER